MKLTARRVLLALVLLFIVMAALGYLTVRRAGGPALVPAQSLFPNNVSAMLKVSDFEAAFQRHWRGRGREDADAAIRDFLKYWGLWDQWVASYGEDGARARIFAYFKALFELVGEETWIVLGEWAPPGLEGTGEVALMLYMREDSPLKTRVGPLAQLLFPGHKITTVDHRGFRIYEYTDQVDRRAITLTRVGGWVCASMRAPGREPILRVIDQFNEARRKNPSRTGAVESGGPVDSAVMARLYPRRFWGQLRQFNIRRGRVISDKSEDRLEKWGQRLEGIDEVRLTQHGDSLLNLELFLTGRRIEALESVLVDTEKEKYVDFDGMIAQVPSPVLFEMDLSHPFAFGGMPIFGLEWETTLENLGDAKWITSRGVKKLEDLLLIDDVPEGGRVGMALIPTTFSPVPVAMIWHDKQPVMRADLAPSDLWQARDKQEIEGNGDFREMIGVTNSTVETTSSLELARRRLMNEAWSEDPVPLGYIFFNFDEIVSWMSSFPMILLKEDDRERWLRYKSLFQSLELLAGSTALRFERSGRDIKLKIRTLEVEESGR